MSWLGISRFSMSVSRFCTSGFSMCIGRLSLRFGMGISFRVSRLCMGIGRFRRSRLSMSRLSMSVSRLGRCRLRMSVGRFAVTVGRPGMSRLSMGWLGMRVGWFSMSMFGMSPSRFCVRMLGASMLLGMSVRRLGMVRWPPWDGRRRMSIRRRTMRPALGLQVAFWRIRASIFIRIFSLDGTRECGTCQRK